MRTFNTERNNEMKNSEKLTFRKCIVSESLSFGVLNVSNHFLNPYLDAKEFCELEDKDVSWHSAFW